MHVALLEGETYDPSGFYAQPDAVSSVITELGAKRVLELGCGQAFNSRYLAQKHPDVEFVGIDLMPHHVKKARERARGLTNVSFQQQEIRALAKSRSSYIEEEIRAAGGADDSLDEKIYRTVREQAAAVGLTYDSDSASY